MPWMWLNSNRMYSSGGRRYVHSWSTTSPPATFTSATWHAEAPESLLAVSKSTATNSSWSSSLLDGIHFAAATFFGARAFPVSSARGVVGSAFSSATLACHAALCGAGSRPSRRAQRSSALASRFSRFTRASAWRARGADAIQPRMTSADAAYWPSAL